LNIAKRVGASGWELISNERCMNLVLLFLGQILGKQNWASNTKKNKINGSKDITLVEAKLG
jgi:hypothetical protein